MATASTNFSSRNRASSGDVATSFSVVNAAGSAVTANGTALTAQILNQGETYVLKEVERGYVVKSDLPLQVSLITGDKASQWELRWFALPPTAAWGTSCVCCAACL